MRSSRFGMLTSVTVLALAVGACASAATPAPSANQATASTTATSTPAPVPAAALSSLLPADVIAKGVVTAATLDGCQPWGWFADDKITYMGVNADLAAGVEQLLGIKINWIDMEFPSQIPSLEAGRVDLIWDCIGDTAAREQVIDFVTYSREGEGVVVAKGNPLGIKTLQDLCGKRITIIQGSMSVQWAQGFQTDCGSNPMQVTELPDMGQMYLSVTAGRADATLVSYGTTAFQTSHDTTGVYKGIELSPVPAFDPAVQGIAFNKKDAQLRDAFKAALEQMMKDGTYQPAFDNQGVGNLTVPTIEINGALDK